MEHFVAKTHTDGSDGKLGIIPAGSWGFKTTRDEKNGELHRKNNDTNLKYTQHLEDVLTVGYKIAKDYQAIFGLNDSQMELLLMFLEQWDVIRQCCGTQMSKHWRAQLISNTYDTSKSMCSTYNITDVEKKLMATPVYKLLANTKTSNGFLKLILRPSIHDKGDLTGTYCQTYNDAVKKYHLEFNHNMPRRRLKRRERS